MSSPDRDSGAVVRVKEDGEEMAACEIERAFGFSRRELLEEEFLYNHGYVAMGSDGSFRGFILARPTAGGAMIGPLVADSEATARSLLARLVATLGDHEISYVKFYELELHQAACKLAQELGFPRVERYSRECGCCHLGDPCRPRQPTSTGSPSVPTSDDHIALCRLSWS